MDNKAVEQSLPGDETVAVPTSLQAVPAGRPGAGLIWRVAIAVLAVAILAILIYPLGQNQGATSIPTVSNEVPATLTDPEATAQANPDSAEAQFKLGNAYAQASQWDQARAAYQKAIELDPSYQAAYANLGVVYYQLEQLDLAASQYQKALELDPGDGEVAYNLGALYLQQALLSGGGPDAELVNRAITQLKQASELAPDLAEPYFSLGVAYQAVGETQAAIQAFETFLARDKSQDPRARQEAERYLQILRNG